MSQIEKDRDAARALVDELVSPHLQQINSTPELLSVLYDLGMLPEQTNSLIGAARLSAFCEVWRRIEDAELSLRIWDKGGESEYWLRYPPPQS